MLYSCICRCSVRGSSAGTLHFSSFCRDVPTLVSSLLRLDLTLMVLSLGRRVVAVSRFWIDCDCSPIVRSPLLRTADGLDQGEC